jgi:hypothetical protein
MAAERRRQLRLAEIERTKATQEQAKGLTSDIRSLYGVSSSGSAGPSDPARGGGLLRNLFAAAAQAR